MSLNPMAQAGNVYVDTGSHLVSEILCALHADGSARGTDRRRQVSRITKSALYFGLHVLAMVDFYCSMHVKSGTFPKVARFFILIEKINHDKMMVFQKGSFDWR